MRYLIGFLKFWRSFIIGDDNRVAITVMWALLGAYAVNQTYLPSWFVVPVAIVILFVVLFVLAVNPNMRIKPTYANKSLYALALPLIAVTALPVALFRLISLDFQLDHFFLPFVIVSFAAVALSFAMGGLFSKFPAFTSFVVGVCAFCYVMFLKPTAVAVSSNILMTVRDITSYILVVFVLVFIVWLLKRDRDSSDIA